MLSPEQVEFFREQGYLRIPQMFTPEQMDALDQDLGRLVAEWATTGPGWSGPWRQVYMDEETDKASKLTAMHDLHLYSQAWSQAVTDPGLAEALGDILGPDVELHHSTMHIKPPSAGHPFTMNQDHPFYMHEDGRYVDVLVHLDDTCHENGEIRFLAGSHKQGALVHITEQADGSGCSPHLSTDEYSLEDTVAVPAQRGDVVFFSIHTIHGSHINRTATARRMVRVGYRDPQNLQTAGQSHGRPGLLVRGYRHRQDGQELLRNT
jgi:hypothetical protein